MKLNRKIARLAASVLATAMFACATALPAMAANPSVSDNKVILTKEIDMSAASGAGIPNGTFTFTINELEPTSISGAESNAKKGIINAVNSGNATVNVTFNNETVASKNMELSFDPSKFVTTGAGLYYYTVSENAITGFSGMTTDANTYILKVQVANDDQATGGLKVASAVMYAQTLGGGNQNTENKVAGFRNEYETEELTITKQVTGDMGDKKKDFTFSITLTDSDTTKHVTSVTYQKVGDSAPTQLNFVNGTANFTVTLADSENVKITGLPVGMEYTIVESENTDYKVSYTGATQDTDDDNKATGTVADGSNLVTVTNNLDSTDIPATGIIMNVAPYVLMVGIAVAGCFVFLRKRRDD